MVPHGAREPGAGPPGYARRRSRMRALIITNMYPRPEQPALGSFVADQVAALRRTGVVEVEVFAFAPGGARAYVDGARALRRRHGHDRFDIVHAHFGLTTWPALAARGRGRVVTLHGTDLAHPRSRPITLAGLRTVDLVATVSEALAREIPAWAAPPGKRAVLPAGVDTGRLLFAADPSRPEKRFDRAQQVAGAARLLTLGRTAPERVPLFVNAANAVVVPSEREGFGLAPLEALACDVPVLATPVGIAPEALAGIDGALCAPFDVAAWTRALEPHLADGDPRIEGRARAQQFSTDVMALRVIDAWRRLLEHD
jgi:teichuronic acid biosynthesis glycosyltransferase TuaC